MQEAWPMRDLSRGICEENPVFAQLLGLCPALAVTNSVAKLHANAPFEGRSVVPIQEAKQA